MDSHFKSSTSNSKEVVNSEELHFTQIQKELMDWKIPKVPTNTIYKEGRLSIMTDYAIKIVEQILPIADEMKSFQLFSKNAIIKHQKKYNFLHMGLVQIGVKPLTKEGLNTAFLLSLRDKRHKKNTLI